MPQFLADVLVVDDNPDVVEAMLLLLGDAGFPARAACDGLQALAAVETARPAVVLLDMLMPVMDGWECARLLRARYGGEVAIVVVSAAEHNRLRAEEVEADEVLSKPTDLDELLRIVGVYVARGARSAP